MTEPSLTQRLLAWLARELGGAVITKHSDRFTSGVPDVSICVQGYTSWIECKVLRPGVKLEAEVADAQLVDLKHRARATRGRAWILAWIKTTREERAAGGGLWRTAIVDPRHPHYPSLAGADLRRLPPTTAFDPMPALREDGAVVVDGIAHGLVRDLILRTHLSKEHER